MIIDLILDRKDAEQDGETNYYIPEQFYRDVFEYGEIGWDITRALDYGTEQDVKHALCKYIDEQNYNPNIKNYINSVAWL